jgi:hypothetical protein
MQFKKLKNKFIFDFIKIAFLNWKEFVKKGFLVENKEIIFMRERKETYTLEIHECGQHKKEQLSNFIKFVCSIFFNSNSGRSY